ncbi:MAG: amidohydrolase family protein [Ignavibacteriae bacterium]|nr:amidohydrolase family protein [Ignavibacteria bacterium]MBI3365626.1 amidohydrolase family protein [Ignavibacteriota bacterium]
MRLIIFWILLVLLSSTLSYSQELQTIAISGATLIDGTGKPPLSNAAVIIEGNRISKVGTTETVLIPLGAQRIDAAGKFVLPGLIDTHLHLEMVGLSDVGELPPQWNKPEKLRQLVLTNVKLNLISGFTTVRDLASTDLVLQVRDEINAGRIVGPRIVAAGMQLVKKDSTAQKQPIFLEYDGPDRARAMVRSLAALGVDVIKIRLTHSRPIPSLEEVRVIIEEAHRLGLRATVHTDVPADDLVKLAIDAGADGIEHNAPLRAKDEQILKMMAQKGMSLMAQSGAFWLQRIDTTALIDSLDPSQMKLYPDDVLSALHQGIDSVHRQTQQMKNSGWDARRRQASFIQEVRRARNAGVLLVFGTDCGAYGMVHGQQYKALYGESQIGSSPMQAILMATRDAAKALGKSNELGTIEAGKLADLIILNADPLIDLRNLHQVFRVIKDGTAYDPAELISATK